MTRINFVRHRRRELTKLELQDRKWLRIAATALGGVIVLSIVVMSFRLFVAYQTTVATKATAKLVQSIKNKQQIENEYLVFIAKAKIITDLFGQRREKQQALAYFSSLFDPSVIISQLSYDADSHALSFSLRAPHVFSLQTVFDTLLSSRVRETYPSFSIQQISRSEDASYAMNIVLPLQETDPNASASGIIETELLPSEVDTAAEFQE